MLKKKLFTRSQGSSYRTVGPLDLVSKPNFIIERTAGVSAGGEGERRMKEEDRETEKSVECETDRNSCTHVGHS